MRLLALLILFLSLPAFADDLLISDKDLNDSIELGEEIEGRADGDLNGDGLVDTAYVVGSVDHRELYVLITQKSEVSIDHNLVGKTSFDTARLGPASLSIAKGVLKVEDLTGGTTAMANTYRYRYDAERDRMRLIGLDATLYSRTYAHDGWKMSWNLLTHQMSNSVLELNQGDGDEAYNEKFERKFKWLSNPIYMEDTPDPEMVYIDVHKK